MSAKGETIRRIREIHGAAILASARKSRKRGRGWESAPLAHRRGTVDIAITGLLFHGGLRRSEAADLEWRDVAESTHVPRALLITLRTSKANQKGERVGVRLVQGGYADAIRELRPVDSADSRHKVLGGLKAASVDRRFKAAVQAAGIAGRITGLPGRIDLAAHYSAVVRYL